MDREQFIEKRKQARRARNERFGMTYEIRLPRPAPTPRGRWVVSKDGRVSFEPDG
jgi:hypothetical protein